LSHLYKKFVKERVTDLVSQTENIRNVTIIAHIDHGKTTLSDSLIAASGLLSKDVAASARLLDYDLIEQQRGITIKASGISLIHTFEENDHLINLVDTPGHIDFSSHVTRGLRLTDGAVIVVDSIEGIMVQTETVTRQAMMELVRPVLFVNKVDRLLRERRLSGRKTAEEINKVVREFNAMLGKYLDDERLEEWEVSFSKGSLSVGSAIDKWGLDLVTLKDRTGGSEEPADLTNAFLSILEEIEEAYKAERQDELTVQFPVARVVLDSVVRVVPNPRVAQTYRVPMFWDGDPGSEIGKKLMECSDSGPCICMVGEVQPDRHASTVTAVRVFSGTLERAKPLMNLRTKEQRKSLQIGMYMSKTRVDLSHVPAGNLAFITGLRDIAVGDTLIDVEGYEKSKEPIHPMSALQYPTEPVVTYTIEPKSLAELGSIQEPIEAYVNTDPALEFEVNPETGEMLISGAGELHIEISVEKLARQGIEVILGKPMVLLKEQLTTEGSACSSENETVSSFTIRATIAVDETAPETFGTVIDQDPRSASWIVDTSNKISQFGDEAEWIKEAFRTIIRNGPTSGERMRRLGLVIERATLRSEAPETSWRDITQPLLEAARESVLSGTPVVLEPWIQLEISAPEEHVGALSAILSKRKGQVLEIDSDRSLFRIDAEIPVRESFGLANEIRTSTSGWATWGAQAGGFRDTKNSEVRYD
jgi:elongation factor 2